MKSGPLVFALLVPEGLPGPFTLDDLNLRELPSGVVLGESPVLLQWSEFAELGEDAPVVRVEVQPNTGHHWLTGHRLVLLHFPSSALEVSLPLPLAWGVAVRVARLLRATFGWATSRSALDDQGQFVSPPWVSVHSTMWFSRALLHALGLRAQPLLEWAAVSAAYRVEVLEDALLVQDPSGLGHEDPARRGGGRLGRVTVDPALSRWARDVTEEHRAVVGEWLAGRAGDVPRVGEAGAVGSALSVLPVLEGPVMVEPDVGSGRGVYAWHRTVLGVEVAAPGAREEGLWLDAGPSAVELRSYRNVKDLSLPGGYQRGRARLLVRMFEHLSGERVHQDRDGTAWWETWWLSPAQFKFLQEVCTAQGDRWREGEVRALMLAGLTKEMRSRGRLPRQRDTPAPGRRRGTGSGRA